MVRKGARNREREEFLKRHNTEREQVALAYDNLMIDTHRFIDNIDKLTESYISQNDTVPRHLLLSRLDLMRFLKDLIKEKDLRTSNNNTYVREGQLISILANDIPKERIQRIVKHLIFEDGKKIDYTKKMLLLEIIRFEKCDELQAKIVYEKMIQMGLTNCYVGLDHDDGLADKYGIVKFGIMCGFVTRTELSYLQKSRNCSTNTENIIKEEN